MAVLTRIRFTGVTTLSQLVERLNRFADVWHSQLTATPALVATPATTASAPAPSNVMGANLTFGVHPNAANPWASLAAGKGITIAPNESGKYVFVSGVTSYIKAFAASPFYIPVFSGRTYIAASAGAGANFVANLPIATGSNNVIVIKKMDANAFNIAITPNGTDTIDTANAVYFLGPTNPLYVTNNGQFASVDVVDIAAGAWLIT